MSQWKIKKEEFVSGLNGTSLVEIFVSSAISPLCILLRSLIIGFLPLHSSPFEIIRYVVDLVFLILPMILAVTIMSNFYLELFVAMLAICVTLVFFIKKFSFIGGGENEYLYSDDKNIIFKNSAKLCDLSSIKIITSNIPFLTSFKVYVNVATCICILAVDFHVFPRRLAKAENFGCGIMDLGVGGFIISNAIVSKEARNKWKSSNGVNIKHFRATCIQILSSWPLIVLGLARLISIKMSGYQEHVTEYGLHWNFFFTLAFVKIFSSLILLFINLKYCALFSVMLAVGYQYTLSSNPLLLSIILGDDRSGSIFMQNKEGFTSLIGYLSLYFAGIECGAFLFKPRNNLRKWLNASLQLFCVGCIFCIFMLLSINYIQPISRRLANLSYILAFLTYATVLLFCYLIGDILIVFLIHNKKLNVISMPNRWAIQNNVNKTSQNFIKKTYDVNSCLISAINRNQLFYFLLSNVLTGLVNSSINTMSIDNIPATFIITLYCFVANFVTWVMHVNNFTFKFW